MSSSRSTASRAPSPPRWARRCMLILLALLLLGLAVTSPTPHARADGPALALRPALPGESLPRSPQADDPLGLEEPGPASDAPSVVDRSPWLDVSKGNTPNAASRELDAVLIERAHAEGVTPARLIGDDAFLRRVTVDLIGRIPTMEEYEAYHAMQAATRRVQWVDRLLDSQGFVNRWAVFYADLLRLRGGAASDRLAGVIRRSLRDRQPYDAFVRSLLTAAGDIKDQPEISYLLSEELEPLALTGVVSQQLLGVRMQCAQCHDHPTDVWTREEFYGLAAYFDRNRYINDEDQQLTLVLADGPATVKWPPAPRRGRPMEPDWPFYLDASHDPARRQAIAQFTRMRREAEERRRLDDQINDVFERTRGGVGRGQLAVAQRRDSDDLLKPELADARSQRRESLADRLTDPANPYFTWNVVNRVWATLIGQGFVTPIDDFRDDNPPSHPEALNGLSHHFIASDWDLRTLVRTIVLTDAYQREHPDAALDDDARQEATDLFVAAHRRVMPAEALFDSLVTAGHLFNEKHSPGRNIRTRVEYVRVARDTVRLEPEGDGAAMDDMNDPADMQDPDAEAGTADADPDPGADAEASAGDDAETPAPVELQLAEQVVDPYAAEMDGDKAEASLDADIESLLDASSTPTGLLETPDPEREQLAAMIREAREKARYTFVRREVRYDDNPVFGSAYRSLTPRPSEHFLRQFGQPSREILGERRGAEPSTRQALILLNGRLANEAARVGNLEPVSRMLQHRRDLDRVVNYLYRSVLTRDPTPDERVRALELLREAGDGYKARAAVLADLRWALLCSHGFRGIP